MKADRDLQWYSAKVKQLGVEHPGCVYNKNPTREAAILQQVARMQGLLQPRDGCKVLEFGCGNLLTADALFRLGVRPQDYTAVEVVPEFIEYGQARGLRVSPELTPNEEWHISCLVGSFAAFNRKQVMEILEVIEAVTADRIVLCFAAVPHSGLAVPDINAMLRRYPRLVLHIEHGYATGYIPL